MGFGAATVLLAVTPFETNAQLFADAPSRVRTLPVSEQVKADREQARFRLGQLRLMPFVGVKDAAYINNVFGTVENQVSDLTVTPNGGVRLIGALGGKLVVRGTGEAEYYYWRTLTARRGWGGSADGEILGLFNRMTFSINGGYASTIQQLTSESESVARQDETFGKATLEVDLLRRLAVFGGFEALRTRLDDAGMNGTGQAQASLLNRTEYGSRAGLRYRFDTRFAVGVMAQWAAARFLYDAIDRDNDGWGALATVRYDRPRLYLDLTGGYQEASARYTGSAFPEYRTATYSYFAVYAFPAGFELQLSGWRRPQYSYFLDNPYFLETRNGGGVRIYLSPRLAVGLSASVGANRYPVEVYVGAALVRREDEVLVGAGQLDLELQRNLLLTLTLRSERYSSNVPGVARTIVNFGGGVRWEFGLFHASGGARAR